MWCICHVLFKCFANGAWMDPLTIDEVWIIPSSRLQVRWPRFSQVEKPAQVCSAGKPPNRRTGSRVHASPQLAVFHVLLAWMLSTEDLFLQDKEYAENGQKKLFGTTFPFGHPLMESPFVRHTWTSRHSDSCYICIPTWKHGVYFFFAASWLQGKHIILSKNKHRQHKAKWPNNQQTQGMLLTLENVFRSLSLWSTCL